MSSDDDEDNLSWDMLDDRQFVMRPGFKFPSPMSYKEMCSQVNMEVQKAGSDAVRPNIRKTVSVGGRAVPATGPVPADPIAYATAASCDQKLLLSLVITTHLGTPANNAPGLRTSFGSLFDMCYRASTSGPPLQDDQLQIASEHTTRFLELQRTVPLRVHEVVRTLAQRIRIPTTSALLTGTNILRAGPEDEASCMGLFG
jgi:hypothetical protein